MLASGAEKAGNSSAGRYINYHKFFSSIFLAVLIKICKYMLNIDPENLHLVHNANFIRAVR